MTAKSINCIWIVLACILFLHHRALSQRHNIKFDHIGTDEGLSHGSVLSLFQDSRGFLWIGTREGLNKYDGYQFTSYNKTDDIIYDVNANTITDLAEDADGNIWMTTQKGNLRMLDIKHDRIIDYIDTTFYKTFTSIEIDGEGNIWIGTEGKGLAQFDRKTKRFTYYSSDEANPSSISNNYIHTLLEDSDGNLWIGTFGGLDLFDPKRRTFTRFKTQEKGDGALTVNGIMCLFEDSKKQLWIGGGNGLNVMEKG
jgi:ligand-binding sensor domain-containing protein